MKNKYVLIGTIVLLAGGAIYVQHKLPRTAMSVASLPTAATPDSRNQIRKDDLSKLTSALNGYIADHGSLPIKIAATPKAICSSISATCTRAKLVDLNFLTASGTYLTSLPSDPVGVHSQYSSGFLIAKDPATGKIVVSAPNAELGAVLSASTR